MTVLAAAKETTRKEGGLKSFLMGTDIIYKGGFVAINPAGLAVAFPVAASAQGMVLAGVAAETVDDSAGAGDKWIRVYTEGLFLVTATSIAQTNLGQMMYIVDDNIVDDEPGAEQIPAGILVEYVSATSGWIDIGPALYQHPTVKRKVITKTAAYTVLAEESGAVFYSGTDNIVFSLPPTQKGLVFTFINSGADGAALVEIDPDAADLIVGNDLIGSDGGKLSNTKATAKRADTVTLVGDGVDGWFIVSSLGVWAIA
jgi:hypothetical protein